MWISAMFALACLAVLVLSLVTRKAYGSASPVAMSLSLLAAWGATKVIAMTADWDTARQNYPIIDVCVLVAAMIVWSLKPAVWKLALAFVAFDQLVLHFAFWSWWINAPHSLYNYQLALNIAFTLEILIVASPGGKIVADRILRSGALDWRGHHRGLPYGAGSDTGAAGETSDPSARLEGDGTSEGH